MGAFDDTRAEVSQTPAAGRGKFETGTHWRDGAQAVSKGRFVTIETDEPARPGGKDQQIDLIELLLAPSAPASPSDG